MASVAEAYSASGQAWAQGPARVYEGLAKAVLACSPVPLAGRAVVDVGAGTGAASRAARAAGARSVVAVDAAVGMLLHDASDRPPAVAADARSLPFPPGAFDAAVAAFSLTHLACPGAGLRELARVVAAGGPVLASAFAADDCHPVKQAVEGALSAVGWVPPPWWFELRARRTPLLATLAGCLAVAAEARLDVDVHALRVAFPELGPADLVAWRLGMPQHATFVAGLSASARRAVVSDALDRLGSPPPLVRSVLVLAGISR